MDTYLDFDETLFAQRTSRVSGSAIREIFKLLSKPNMISFAGGNPAKDALPNEQIADIARDLLLKEGKTLLQYGATEGYAPFLNTLEKYIANTLGFTAKKSEILPTTGSTQGMNLLCSALINQGDVILVEDPTFLGNMQVMRLFGAQLIPVVCDADGMDMQDLENKIQQYHPKMIYVIPTFQNPTGRTLSFNKRKKIAELANEYHVLVAEDDPYRDLRYEGAPLPTIKSFDTNGYVAFLGSFSKIISPGLRVGYLCANEKLLRKCTVLKQSSDLHTALLNQALCNAYIEQDLLQKHVQEISASYKQKMQHMLHEMSKTDVFASYTKPQGGLFIFCFLEEKTNALTALQKAVDLGVAYVPGTHFYPNGEHFNTLRLNFSNASLEDITKGIALLNQALKA